MTLAGTLASALAFTFYTRVEWYWLPLGFVGLVPWMMALDRTPSLGAAFGAGLLMSAAFVIAVFAWFASAITTYTGGALATSMAVLILLAPLLQPQLVTFALARHVTRRSGFWSATVIGACIYVGTEWAFPKLFGDTIGHGFYASAWMRQVADLAGVPGCTFLLVVANACALEVVSSTGHRRAAVVCLVAMLGALLAYGVVRERQFARTDGAFEVGVVQADITSAPASS